MTVGSVVLSKPLFFRRGPDRHRRGSSEAVAPRNVSHGVWEDDGSDADEAWEEVKNGDGDDAGESGYGQMKLHVYILLCAYDLELYVCTSATDVYAEYICTIMHAACRSNHRNECIESYGQAIMRASSCKQGVELWGNDAACCSTVDSGRPVLQVCICCAPRAQAWRYL